MRAALLKRRRRGPSLPADLVALLATEPTVLVQLKYNVLSGRYVLFQDPACTVPVEEDGDPIGGVIQPSLALPPEDWTIAAVQSSDANRVVWGGVVGGVFSGGQNLIVQPSVDFITQTGIFSALVDTTWRSDGLVRQIMGGSTSGADATFAMVADDNSFSQSVSTFWSDGGGARSVRMVDLFAVRETVLAATVDGTILRSYADGEPGPTTSVVPSSGAAFTGQYRIGSTGTGGLQYTGDIRHVALWGRALSPAEVGDLS